MRSNRLIGLCAVIAFLGAASTGFTCQPDTTSAQRVTAAEALSPIELLLEDGRTVRLASVRAASLDVETDAMAQAGRDALSAFSQGQPLHLVAAQDKPDRHGRVWAHLIRPGPNGPEWVQEQLVHRGMLMVDTSPKDRNCARQLLAAEDEARRAEHGIWRDEGAAEVIDAKTAARLADQFLIVEGTILSVKTVRGVTYLNFGERWKTDFTVIIKKSGAKSLAKDGIDLQTLEGARIRVRGYAIYKNGAEITWTHAEQLEVLSRPGRPAH